MPLRSLQSTPHLLQNTPATPESFPDLLTHFSTFKLNNGQSSVNSNSTSTSSTNTNSSLDGKSQISPLVSHIQHHYHNYPSSNLVHNMKWVLSRAICKASEAPWALASELPAGDRGGVQQRTAVRNSRGGSARSDISSKPFTSSDSGSHGVCCQVPGLTVFSKSEPQCLKRPRMLQKETALWTDWS